MCQTCHTKAEQAIELAHSILDCHPGLKVDVRITSDETLIELCLHRLDRAASEAAVHSFEQVVGASVSVCHCGRWPLHHVHTGDRAACTCADCRGGGRDA